MYHQSESLKTQERQNSMRLKYGYFLIHLFGLWISLRCFVLWEFRKDVSSFIFLKKCQHKKINKEFPVWCGLPAT